MSLYILLASPSSIPYPLIKTSGLLILVKVEDEEGLRLVVMFLVLDWLSLLVILASELYRVLFIDLLLLFLEFLSKVSSMLLFRLL